MLIIMFRPFKLTLFFTELLFQVGIGDPHCVVFHLPGDYCQIHVCQPIHRDSAAEISLPLDASISEELLLALMRLLKKYLMDDSVKIIDMTSQTLRVSMKLYFSLPNSSCDVAPFLVN